MKTSDSERQQVVQRLVQLVAASENKWHRVTTNGYLG